MSRNLTRLAALYRCRRTGKRPNVAVLRRWQAKGVLARKLATLKRRAGK